MTILESTTHREPDRHRFTRAEYHRFAELDFFGFERRCELIDGDIIDKMGQKEPHPSLVIRLLFALASIFGQAHVRSQSPIVLTNESEPEPDVTVTAQSDQVYVASGETPSASDVRLVAEVSVSTLQFDLSTKALLYSRAGIPEYWVVDAANRRLVIHRDPTPAGFASIVSLDDTQTVSPTAAPRASLRVADLLP
jgi:Uma2 family endonuclease